MTLLSRRSPSLRSSLLLASILVAGCSAKHEAEPATTTAPAPAPAAAAPAEPRVATAGATEEALATRARATDGDAAAGFRLATPADDRKIIRTGTVELQVADYEPARAALEAMVKAAGGFVDSTQVHHYEGASTRATLVLRIPGDGYGPLVHRLGEIGVVVSEATDASDITEQYVDLAARLGNAKRLEQRMLELAATRTGRLSDVLEVERELGRIRAEVEQMEGHLRLWDHQVSLSTLTVTLTTKVPALAAVPEPGVGTRVSGGFGQSLATLEEAATSALVFAIAALPWLLIGAPFALLLRRWLRRVRPVALPRAAQK